MDPNDVNYVSYDGGGPLTSALLGEKIDVGFSGLAEFVGQVESGELRVLAVSGEERYPDGPFAEVPTLTESGVDLCSSTGAECSPLPRSARSAPTS